MSSTCRSPTALRHSTEDLRGKLAGRLPCVSIAEDEYVVTPEMLYALHAFGVEAAGTAPNTEEGLKLLQFIHCGA